MPRATKPFRPTPQQLADAVDKRAPDLIGPGLRVLFCGINPGLWTGATGCHFARPGNRFWPALFSGGFTPELISPFDEHRLLPLGLGITNIAMRTTATAAELTSEELLAGAKALRRKVIRFQPRLLAVLGVSAYRIAFAHKAASLGLQPDRIGQTHVWILPNPSGLNAHYTPRKLGELFGEVRVWLERQLT